MIPTTKVLTLIVFGLLFINLSAQEEEYSNDEIANLPDDDRTFRLGLQFSPNLSWLKPNSTGYESDGSKFGFSYGLSFEYFMTQNYLLSSGVNILSTGGKIVYMDPEPLSSIIVEEDIKLKYIEIPILLKLRTNEIGYMTYYGQFGLKTGFNFSSKSKVGFDSPNSVGFNIIPTNGVDYSSDINFMNISLAIGGGVEYNISGNTSLMLGLTYNNGFVDQFDGDASSNLNYVALNIGIYF